MREPHWINTTLWQCLEMSFLHPRHPLPAAQQSDPQPACPPTLTVSILTAAWDPGSEMDSSLPSPPICLEPHTSKSWEGGHVLC